MIIQSKINSYPLHKTIAVGGLAALLLAPVITGCASTPGNDTDPSERVDGIDRKLWFEAAEAGNADLLLAMIEQGTDLIIERNGLTALHITARDGHVEATRVLIEAGIDVNLGPDAFETQIASAAAHGSPRMVELMTGSPMDPVDVANAMNLRTPLNLAVQGGHIDVVAALIDSGADVNAGGEWYRPLHSAVMTGDVSMVELLLDNDVHVNELIRIQDRSKFSGFRYAGPLELALIIDRKDIAELLQQHGARN